jgi:hypothetical protein
MNLLALARAAKICALVAFTLPWVEVSCSGVHESASGVTVALGQARHLGPNWFVIAAAAVIVGGLALSLVGRAGARARTLLAASVIAVALCVAGAATRGHQDQGLNRQLHAPVVQVQMRYGFWLTLACLVAAAALSGAALTGRGGREAPPG